MLSINFSRKHYFPSDIVDGNVMLSLKKPLEIEDLKLTIFKFRKILVKDAAKEKAIADDSSRLYEFKHSFLKRTEVSSGVHVFPFKFIIRPNDGASTSVRGNFSDIFCHIENCYELCVESLTSDGETMKFNRPLIIYDRPEDMRNLDIKIRINSFLCIFNTTHHLRISTDKPYYNAGDSVIVSCQLTSYSSKSIISKITSGLYEQLFLSIGNNPITKSRLLMSIEGSYVKRNSFNLCFRLPDTVSASVAEDRFTMKIALLLGIDLMKGHPIKVKKYIYIGRPDISIPEIEDRSFLIAKTYDTVLLDI